MNKLKKEKEDLQILCNLQKQDIANQIKINRKYKSLVFALGCFVGLVFGVIGTYLIL